MTNCLVNFYQELVKHDQEPVKPDQELVKHDQKRVILDHELVKHVQELAEVICYWSQDVSSLMVSEALR